MGKQYILYLQALRESKSGTAACFYSWSRTGVKGIVAWEIIGAARTARDTEKRDTPGQPEHVIRGVGGGEARGRVLPFGASNGELARRWAFGRPVSRQPTFPLLLPSVMIQSPFFPGPRQQQSSLRTPPLE